jgi:hypothetical protein
MSTLLEIAGKYPTDKGPTGHNYIEKYEMFFEASRNQKLKILEIGVDKGYSVKMWKEYFPQGEIYAIDIVDKKEYEEDRITIGVGSQNDPEFLNSFNATYGPFDIIIDDGSHINSDMTFSFNHLFPLLKAGGLYVVEDIHASYWSWVQLDGSENFTNRVKHLLDSVNKHGKAGLACKDNWNEDAVYKNKMVGDMDYWDLAVESVHAFMSIVFIYKSK